jgi:hypothetical protein
MEPIDPMEIMGAIHLLATVVCDLARELEGLSKQKPKGKGHIRSAVEGVTLGIVGGVAIFINASSAAATLGLSAAGSAVSAVVGAELIREGVAHLRS